MKKKASFIVSGIYDRIVIVRHPLDIDPVLLAKISTDNIVLCAAITDFKKEILEKGQEEIFEQKLNYIVTSSYYYFAANEKSFVDYSKNLD